MWFGLAIGETYHKPVNGESARRLDALNPCGFGEAFGLA